IFYNESQLLSIINKIQQILILNHFYNWLKVSILYGSQPVLFHRIPFNYEDLPLFIIESKNNNSSVPQIRFWTFLEANQKDILSKIKCPFDTVSLRRRKT
ncbi:hypothetical protein V7127_25725, partial [Bacillus sp. JJ1773]|uniref:hypothetical protein n=1 Tax=Bacillus sp. JJ1773 TaxID=3122965 RepID=UPI002FFED6E1